MELAASALFANSRARPAPNRRRTAQLASKGTLSLHRPTNVSSSAQLGSIATPSTVNAIAVHLNAPLALALTLIVSAVTLATSFILPR
jgi:hypothetical protein